MLDKDGNEVKDGKGDEDGDEEDEDEDGEEHEFKDESIRRHHALVRHLQKEGTTLRAVLWAL